MVSREEVEKWWKEQGFVYDPPFEVKKKVYLLKVSEGKDAPLKNLADIQEGEWVRVRGQVIDIQEKRQTVWLWVVDDTACRRVIIWKGRTESVPQVGDIIEVYGRVKEWQGELEVNASNFFIESKSNALDRSEKINVEAKQEQSQQTISEEAKEILDNLARLGWIKKGFVESYLKSKGLSYDQLREYFEERGEEVRVKEVNGNGG